MSTNDYDSVERPNSMSNIVKTERMKSELERELIQESSVRTFPAASDATTTECSSRKRKKLSGDERINRK